jgi:PncC family amidohydrolase
MGARLRELNWTLATAESCTGGLLGHQITNAPGSSHYFLGGVVSYSDDAKTKILGVPEDILAEHGAVSEETAQAMAEGVRKRFHADVGVGVTGIAGPGGGTEEKPVGLVFVAVSNPNEGSVVRHQFDGVRTDIKEQTAEQAILMILEQLS